MVRAAEIVWRAGCLPFMQREIDEIAGILHVRKAVACLTTRAVDAACFGQLPLASFHSGRPAPYLHNYNRFRELRELRLLSISTAICSDELPSSILSKKQLANSPLRYSCGASDHYLDGMK
jgi:hypothetical protein